jgi:hypothetical protein
MAWEHRTKTGRAISFAGAGRGEGTDRAGAGIVRDHLLLTKSQIPAIEQANNVNLKVPLPVKRAHVLKLVLNFL